MQCCLCDLCGPCRYDLHVLFVNHGKRCPRCAKNGKPRKPSDGDCPLFGKQGIAKHKQEPKEVSEDPVKSEEDASADSDIADTGVTVKHEAAVKTEADNVEVKQEPNSAIKAEPGAAED